MKVRSSNCFLYATHMDHVKPYFLHVEKPPPKKNLIVSRDIFAVNKKKEHCIKSRNQEKIKKIEKKHEKIYMGLHTAQHLIFSPAAESL